MNRKPVVAFLCIQNSCRSQMAEAFGRHLAEDVFISRSAGTCPAERINPSAQQLMKNLYGIDMEKEGQFPKKLEDLSAVDMVVTMGCGVRCPVLPGVKTLAWEIPDPAGKPDPEFRSIMETIRSQVLALRDQLKGAVTK
ncbi:arsenate reductase ArsC [uncultured Acidaminococcus sp.]|uniref:arsenate reductase ArsC n=1 Tax=uncultured Acidaminococcus sp. TaxID=352152 RepID=UPI00262338BA|nr:arsenate reductase ArsC [uncultured Acidaminococcus sp.]